MLIGTPVDFKRFYLEKGSVPSIYVKQKDSLDIDYSRHEGRLANRFFPKKHQYLKSPPPPKKKIFFGLGRPVRDMLSILRDDGCTTLSTTTGLF